jgi:hypothetical protein
MTKKFLTTFSLFAILFLSACGGAEATPDLSAEDISNTAVAEAFAILTLTQAAMPAATPVPPTATFAPTNTSLPTIEVLIPTLPPATLAVAATATPECNQIPALEPKGTLTTVEIKNESQGTANFAFGMNSPNDKGECYTYSFTLGRGDVTTAKVLAGCYWGYAWITGDEPSVARSNGALYCLTDTARIYHLTISKESLSFN